MHFSVVYAHTPPIINLHSFLHLHTYAHHMYTYVCTQCTHKLQKLVKEMSPVVIKPGNALKLRALQVLEDKDGTPRYTGELWLVREVGSYLPGVLEEVGHAQTHAHTHTQACICSCMYTCASLNTTRY